METMAIGTKKMKKLKVRMVYEVEGTTEIEVPDHLSLREAVEYAHDYQDSILLPTDEEYVLGSERLVDEDTWAFA